MWERTIATSRRELASGGCLPKAWYRRWVRAAERERARAADAPKERLIDCALDEVANRGLQNLTLKAVAIRAGCAHSLIAHHFNSKEGLLEACAERWRREITVQVTGVLAAFNAPSDPFVGAHDALSLAFDVTRERQSLMRVLMRSVIYQEGLTERVLDTTEPVLENFTHILAGRFGLEERRCRAVVHHAGILVTRLALAADSELARLYPHADDDVWGVSKAEAIESVLTLLRAGSRRTDGTS